jgi:hypothetical protein
MSTKDFTANVISATKVVPDGNFKDSKASGIWDINEALDLIKGGNWPNVANISPSAFVDALFQTHLYTGNASSRSIDNGINLSSSGGLVWIKGRLAGGFSNYLFDTERGVTKYIRSNESNGEGTDTDTLTAFNTNGFSVGSANATNYNTGDMVSWTFRKQPKFFDIVKYTGNATNRTISHSLGSVPGMILVKDLSGGGAWAVYHRSVGNGAGQNYVLTLNTTAGDASGVWNGTSPTSSVFTVGTDGTVNEDGRNFVAYLFAHHNDDGGFGVAGDQDIIKCGHYETNNSEEATIDLGFEPQWVLFKRYNSSTEGDWLIYDSRRGMQGDFLNQAALLEANTNDAEDFSTDRIAVTPTGFKVDNWGTSSSPFIFMAIRRGGMQTPTAASSVFTVVKGQAANTSSVPGFTANHVVDFALSTQTSSASRVTGTSLLGDTFLSTDSNSAETANSVTRTRGYQNGFFFTDDSADSARIAWMWARAKGYFDILVTKSLDSQVTHNLGVAPEIVLYKRRDATSDWSFCTGVDGFGKLNSDAAFTGTQNGAGTGSNLANATATNVYGGSAFVGGADRDMVIYLFATAAGVSKVGSFTQNGATNVACGFTGDTPAFILLKRTDDSGNWYLFDSDAGIVAGNDPHHYFNTTDAQITNADIVDPYSGGFATTSSLTNGSYIFYAIASIA